MKGPAAAALFLAFFSLPSPCGAEEEAVRVYYPPGRTVVTEDQIVVEGSVGDPEISEVEIDVNGESYRADVDEFVFAEEVYLDHGVNTVTVGGVVRKVFYRAGEEEASKSYREFYGHYDLTDGCLECHEVTDEGEFTLEDEPGKICGWCHDAPLSGQGGEEPASVHGPVRDGECLSCHLHHLSPAPALLRDDRPGCEVCHEETFDRIAKERYVHGPINLGDCRLCHTVHSSPQPALLLESPTTLCVQCHSEVAVREGTPPELYPHTMIPEGECGTCHQPHSSEHPGMMREPSSRVCYRCHAEKTKSFHEKKGFSIYVCQKCHNLHRPTSPHLIADSSSFLCLKCHEFSEEAAFTHEFIREGGCFTCHSFHAAPLSDDIAALCLRCHGDNPQLGAAHGGIPIAGTKCTLCHRPHQSDQAKLLYATEHSPFEERDCASCHEDPSASLVGEVRGLCEGCHTDKMLDREGGGEVHPPFAEKDCSFCHSSHTAPAENLLRQEQLDLCLGCHRKFKRITVVVPKSVHESVRRGECGTCHDPHLSPNRKLLRQEVKQLCRDCHGDLLTGPSGEAWKVPHEPVAAGKCRLCHEVHSARRSHLLKSPMPKGCRPCHTEFFSKLKQAGDKKTHEPVREGDCPVCHDVHGSDGTALLDPARRDDVCTTCHPSPKGGHHLYTAAELREKAGKERDNACLYCHRPHSSSERRLLRGRDTMVCKRCHQM